MAEEGIRELEKHFLLVLELYITLRQRKDEEDKARQRLGDHDLAKDASISQ